MSYEKAQFGLDIRRWRTMPRMPDGIARALMGKHGWGFR